jgi:hypothetical protein
MVRSTRKVRVLTRYSLIRSAVGPAGRAPNIQSDPLASATDRTRNDGPVVTFPPARVDRRSLKEPCPDDVSAKSVFARESMTWLTIPSLTGSARTNLAGHVALARADPRSAVLPPACAFPWPLCATPQEAVAIPTTAAANTALPMRALRIKLIRHSPPAPLSGHPSGPSIPKTPLAGEWLRYANFAATRPRRCRPNPLSCNENGFHVRSP